MFSYCTFPNVMPTYLASANNDYFELLDMFGLKDKNEEASSEDDTEKSAAPEKTELKIGATAGPYSDMVG
jgi:hypothetical protein